MHSSASPPALVIHDGELGDVCALLGQMGTPFEERHGASTESDESRVWAIVVSTPRRLLEFDAGASGSQPPRVAIMEKESRTLRSMLHRAGVDLLVRRPVHPEALRLLLLYTLYRGPEKRRALRVSVGAEVRYRCGLRRRKAVLAELSTTGCRLLGHDTIERGSKIQLQLPGDVAGGRGMTVSGNVVRCLKAEHSGLWTVAVGWGRQRSRVDDRLREIVGSYSQGPAMLEGHDHFAPLRPPPLEGEAREEPEAAPDVEGEAPAERRASERRAYTRHVIALGVEAARVLLGRDISLGGMRVGPHPDVQIGDELSIALHVRAREKPLVVKAAVVRDEGEAGVVLQWSDLPPDARDYIARMVEYLPVIQTREDGGDGTGVVVSEILEHQASDAG